MLVENKLLTYMFEMSTRPTCRFKESKCIVAFNSVFIYKEFEKKLGFII